MSLMKSIPCAALLALAACSGGDEKAEPSGKVTETVMDDIDSLDGTISDEMISIEEVTSQAPRAGGGSETPAAKSGGDAAPDDASTDGEAVDASEDDAQ